MSKIDIHIIKGTEKVVLRHLPARFNTKIEEHKNVTLLRFETDESIEQFRNLRVALSVTN